MAHGLNFTLYKPQFGAQNVIKRSVESRNDVERKNVYLIGVWKRNSLNVGRNFHIHFSIRIQTKK